MYQTTTPKGHRDSLRPRKCQYGAHPIRQPPGTVFVRGTIRLNLRTKTSVDGIPSGATAARRPLRPHEALAQRLSVSAAPRAVETGAYLPAIL